MILRDMYCTRCRRIVNDVAVDSLAVVAVSVMCSECGCVTLHEDTGYGGSKLRCFVTDFHARQWSTEEAQFVRAGIEQDGSPVIDHKTGEPIEDRAAYQQDAVSEQRDKIAHADDRIKGSLPIVIDQARR